MQPQATWIVHGDAQAREALARMAGVPALTGAPRLDAFPPAPSPGAVVLHVPLAAQEALAFAHNAAWQHTDAHWLLLVDPGLDAGWVAAAFAPLRHAVLVFPPEPAVLRQAIRRALAGGTPSLTALRQRDALVARFTRTLGDLALPDQVADASGHFTVRGERGTGRLLLARTLHALAGAAGDERVGFALLAGDAAATAPRLEAQLAEAAERAERLTVCVEAPEKLARSVQRELASWVELGPPGVPLDPMRILWIFLCGESFGASAPLEDTLGEICEAPALRLPPLRERPGAALRFAEQWLREWYAARGDPPRALSAGAKEAIARDPWPGNARELEAALHRAVASPGEAPIEADALALAAPGAASAAPPAAQPSQAPAMPQPAAAAPPSVVQPDAQPEPIRSPDDELAIEATLDAAVAAPPEPPVDSTARLRTLARAAARELAPALEALREKGNAPATTRLARRLARLEQFAGLDLDTSARTDAASLLARLLEERRPEIDAKRLLVLRELEAESTAVRGGEEALRFALGAVLDALLEAARSRADLYVSARPELGGGVKRVRVQLRFHGAMALSDDELQLVLAREVLHALGAELATFTHGAEHEVRIELPA